MKVWFIPGTFVPLPIMKPEKDIKPKDKSNKKPKHGKSKN